jgi:hypothetical protein
MMTEGVFVMKGANQNTKVINMDEHYKQWLNGLNVGDEVVVEQPSYRFRYYPTTVREVEPNGTWAKGFPGVLFVNGKCQIGRYKYNLLKPTDEILDIINLINIRKHLASTDWDNVNKGIVMGVWELVYTQR